jgi:ubiquinol-cytochrome c reductase iron-sulfur subunit
MNAADPSRPSRRNLLFMATGMVATTGVIAAASTLFMQLRPSGGVREAADLFEVDVGMLQPGDKVVRPWKNLPVIIARRTDAMLTAMAQSSLRAAMIDADSAKPQQPPYTRNWHRSIDPRVSVLVGVCTKCACVPEYFTDEESGVSVAGGYVCPCCAAHFDPAGRAYSGVAPLNLPVPPYRFLSASTLLVGQNPPGQIYFFESIDRV